MQVKLGPLVTAAAGSIGGTTFQRNPVATQVRVKPLPILRRTVYTNAERGYAGQYARTWATLSAAQRTGWQTVADSIVWYNKFGDVIRGLGYWLFLQSSLNMRMLTLTPITTALPTIVLPAITGASGNLAVAGSFNVSWSAPNPVPAQNRWAVFCSPPMSAGRSAQYGKLRFIGSFATGAAPPVNIYSFYIARFPTPRVVGQVIFVEIVPYDSASGYPGVPVRYTASVV